MNMKKFYIFSAGCIRRGMDCIQIKKYLEINGWAEANRPRKANIIIVATCGVVDKNEKNSLEAVEKAMMRKCKDSVVIITGCLSKINPAALERIGTFHYVPNGELERIDSIIKPRIPMKDVLYPDSIQDGGSITDYLIARSFCRKSDFYKKLFDRYSMNSTFLKISVILGKLIGELKKALSFKNNVRIKPYYNIKIADGCLNHCSFCATRFATETLKSRPLDEILDNFNRGLERGYEIFQLLSEDSGCYGIDIGSSITELLQKMFAKQGKYKLTLIDFGPRWLIEQQETLIPLLAQNQDRVKELFLPFQSGSNKLLDRMKRGYKFEELVSVLKLLRKKAPKIAIRTSVLVGFPGESEEDFGATARVIQEIDFEEITINRYEDRPLTPSSKFADKVPPEIIESRAQFLVKNMGCNLLS
jgi:tRNA A37 methylthiotransferase MiaB